MATARGRSRWLRICSGANTYAKWQDSYPGQTIDDYTYLPLEVGSILLPGGSGEGATQQVQIPDIPETRAIVDAAVAGLHLAEVTIRDYAGPFTATSPPIDTTVAALFIGQVIDAESDFRRITLTIGSAIAPIGVQIPGRYFSPSLVGIPYLWAGVAPGGGD